VQEEMQGHQWDKYLKDLIAFFGCITM